MRLLLIVALAFTANCSLFSTKPKKTLSTIYESFAKLRLPVQSQLCSNSLDRIKVDFFVAFVHSLHTRNAVMDQVLSAKRVNMLDGYRREYARKLSELVNDPFTFTWFNEVFCDIIDTSPNLDTAVVRMTQAFEMLVGPHRVVHKINDGFFSDWTIDPATDTFMKTVKHVFRVSDADSKGANEQAIAAHNFDLALRVPVEKLIFEESKGQVKSISDACKALIWVDAVNRGHHKNKPPQAIAAKVREFFTTNHFSANCCGNAIQRIFMSADQKQQQDAKREQKKRSKEAKMEAKKVKKIRLRDRVC